MTTYANRFDSIRESRKSQESITRSRSHLAAQLRSSLNLVCWPGSWVERLLERWVISSPRGERQLSRGRFASPVHFCQWSFLNCFTGAFDSRNKSVSSAIKAYGLWNFALTFSISFTDMLISVPHSRRWPPTTFCSPGCMMRSMSCHISDYGAITAAERKSR